MEDVGATLRFLFGGDGGDLVYFKRTVRCPLKQIVKWVSGSLNLMLELGFLISSNVDKTSLIYPDKSKERFR